MEELVVYSNRLYSVSNANALKILVSRNRERNTRLFKNESVGFVMQNCKQRAQRTRAKTERTATTETIAVMRAKTMRGATMTGRRSAVPSCGHKNQNCGFCVSKTRIHYWYHVMFTSRQEHFYFYSNKFGADLCSLSGMYCKRLFEKWAH